jgi:soluble lytic murein transglycosylase-like protein
MIEIIMVLEQDRMLVKTWNDMFARVKPAMRDQTLTQKVIAYLERRHIDTRPDLWPLVETMASEYPHSDGGRWAFQKLQKLADLEARPYVYSVSLINRLSANTNLDEGLKYFLIELTKGPVRYLSGKVGTMEDFERMTYLFQNRFWNESRRLVEARIDELRFRQNQNGRIQYAKALNLLAQIQSRQGDFEQAARTWSIYIASFQDVVDTRVAVENLADNLARLRLHREAAKIYESLAKSTSVDPVIRWHHFWNLYLAQEYASALALLERGNYVPHRDRGIEGGLDYWRARIFEKQGKQTEAIEIYKKILSQNGDGFYSTIIQARHPRLIESVRLNIDSRVTLSKAPFDNSSALAVNVTENVANESQGIEGLAGIPNNVKSGPGETRSVYQSYMKTAAALGKWGQKQIGRRLLRLVPTAERKGGSGAWVESFRLAVDLKDYSYGFKAPQMIDSPLRRIPSALPDLEVHMLRFNPDWKLMYPYAYRDIIEPVSRAADVDPYLLLSLMRAESVYDEDAQSHVGAQGLMQIMPFTAVRLARVMQDSEFQLSELRQPEINISYAAFYVRMLADYYKGNTLLAVAAYNGGPASVDRWLTNYGDLDMDELVETMTFRETRRYVKSVFRNLGYYKFIWQQSRALAYLPKVPSETAGGEIF